tara:strand:- start:5828 stop:7861 length:2034 start_codon:yes stop_codon:yes gene_type:complete
MSSNNTNKRELQRESQTSTDHFGIEPSHKSKRKCLTVVSYALMLGSTSAILAGCQSSSTLPQSPITSKSLIDFNTADTEQNQAQSKAFNEGLNANAARYQQLFDQNKYPNTETQAKMRLLTAIRQHLVTEHVSVSQANYQSVPFINPDSIDAGSSSFLRTILELYAYKNTDVNDYSAEANADESAEAPEIDNYGEEGEYAYATDSATEAVAVAADEQAVDATRQYDEDGYDAYGYDQNGYDEDGYDQDGYNEYGNQRDDNRYSSGKGGLLSTLTNLNPRDLVNDYEDMQASKQLDGTQDKNSTQAYQGGLTQLINMFIRTPEQVEALNAYQYQYLTFNSVSQYKPKQKQIQSVYSYDYIAPTVSSSVQIPLAFDFDKSRVTIDPSAFMPIVALVNPEHAPLPTQMASHTVNFGLPKTITSQIPSAVIYDAVIAALENSMAELAPDYFSAVDIRDDQFAKQVGADRAVKIYFGSRQSGGMIGKMFKNISRSLQNYVDANPDRYPDETGLKRAITKIERYNKGYQSGDIGSLLQFIEAISPISFNHTNYYYLDKSDRLLAKQQQLNIGSDFFGSQNTVLNQTRYDSASFNKHPLTSLLAQSFGTKAPAAIDGNTWLAKQRQQEERLEKARYARYDYIEEDVEAAEASVDYAEDAVSFSRDTTDDTDYMDSDASSFEGDN